jgi:proteasome lid subunit RPN8/RPN11
MPASAIIRESALISVIATVAEVYKKECYGILLGRVYRNAYRITNAIAIQRADRLYTSVEVGYNHFQSILKNLEHLPKFKIIGEFHSHPQFGSRRGVAKLSKEDIEDTGLGPLQIVVAANDVVTKRKWKATKEGHINGSLGNISMIIKAFTLNNDISAPIPLQCNFLDRWQ